MYNTELCPVCRGTGREEYKSLGEIGETIVKHITCELCGGTGRRIRLYKEDRYDAKPFLGFCDDSIWFDCEDY